MTGPQIRIEDDVAAVSRAAATHFVSRSATALSNRGDFTVVLSGGSTPKTLYSMLASTNEYRKQIAWNKIHFFWGDERHVPPDHPDSNYRMANETLLSKIDVPQINIHRIPGEMPDASLAAHQYEEEIRKFFQLTPDQLPRFDLVFLGIGNDGHTASLFPGTEALHERKHLVVSNWVNKFSANRITMTVPVFNNAACVIFLVCSSDKAESLKAVLEGAHQPSRLPAQLIRPAGELIWIIDREAGQLLTLN